MEFLLFIAFVAVVLVFLKLTGLGSLELGGESIIKQSSPYHYGRRKYLMTRSENRFFKLLVESVGSQVNVFPQVRLSSLLYRAKGIERKYWHAALARINQKSVDYVLCDKFTGEILLVIELDDPTHDTSIRQKRDADVNEMLREAGMPFLRFRDVSGLTRESIATEIYEITPAIFKEPSRTVSAPSVYR
jgi:very-short-patch-repair endonuclease